MASTVACTCFGKLLKPRRVLLGRFAGGHQSQISGVPGIGVDVRQLTQQIDIEGLMELVRDSFPESSQIVDSGHIPFAFFPHGLEALLDALLGMKRNNPRQVRISSQSTDRIEVFTRLDEPCFRNGLHTSTP
jgi:hypothetical protein